MRSFQGTHYMEYVYYVQSSDELHDAVLSFESLYAFMEPYLPKNSRSVMPCFSLISQELDEWVCLNDRTEISTRKDTIDWQDIENKLCEDYNKAKNDQR